MVHKLVNKSGTYPIGRPGNHKSSWANGLASLRYGIARVSDVWTIPGLAGEGTRGRLFPAVAISCLVHAVLIAIAISFLGLPAHVIEPDQDEPVRVTLGESPPEGTMTGRDISQDSTEAMPDSAPSPDSAMEELEESLHNVKLPKDQAAFVYERHVGLIRLIKPGGFRNGASGMRASAASGRNGIGSRLGMPGGAGDDPFPADLAATPPRPTKKVLPIYPAEARRKGIEGVVMLEMTIDQKGEIVGPIEVRQSLPLLDQAAIDALKQWRFAPALDRDGHPVRVILDVPMQFELD